MRFEFAGNYEFDLNKIKIDITQLRLFEAFNLGMLVASTNVGGIPFIAENDHTAVLFDPKDYITASVVLRNIFTDQARAKRICLNGFTYGQKFRLSKVIIDWYNLLDEVEAGM